MSAYSEIADAIVDHAESIARLGARRLDVEAFDAAVDEHVHAIRVLAVSHIDPLADRAFFKAIKAATARASGVYVHMPDGIVEFLVDTARGQRRFQLWNAKELREGGPA
ncbi:hypothetical protein DWG18_11985 [Lysobacter sp. TY2-98]|uniref:hypothetical protein n=1 Tax=Lysobacter sp. TY2-98 TaxID=2290922 RepID=UPI000E20C1AF|nr:hypothetical protein [Lysobacter sp. TY2-98]AXK72924.1 hypothetical protein DWG18_11985 [Lysobacter sp. TY2-98]